MGRQILHVDDTWVNENKRECNKEEEKSLKIYNIFSNIIHYFNLFCFTEIMN